MYIGEQLVGPLAPADGAKFDAAIRAATLFDDDAVLRARLMPLPEDPKFPA